MMTDTVVIHEATSELANAFPGLNTLPIATGRLHPSAEALLDAPHEVRAAKIIQDHMVLYPALQQVVSEAEWMLYEPRQTRARGRIICADRSNGKTSIADLIHQRFCEYDRSDRPCVLRISMSGLHDARSVYGRIMEELGSPARISHRLSDRELLVQRLLHDVNCRLLILDEVQDILNGNERDQVRVLEAVKLLMNELHLPIMAFGTEAAARGFRSDSHLAARFTDYTLPTWQTDETLANFLATYERLLPLKKPSNLASPDKLAVLAKVGEGVLGKIVERVKNAALAAIVDGSECISKQHLKTALMRPAICLVIPKPGTV
jgi:hypothetical protein